MAFKPVLAHYHLYPGGVSTLLLNSIEILYRQGILTDDLIFVLGTEERSEWFFDEFRRRTGGKLKYRLEICPRLMYWEPSFGDIASAAEEIAAKFRVLTGQDRVLWAHNPTLGKNPAYTLALKKLAALRPDLPIWMHIHDSAEQGRWANLTLMKTSLPEPYYFVSPGTRWIVINRTDYDAFLNSGMPRAHLFHVPNPIPLPDHRPQCGKREIGTRLSAFARSNRFDFDPDREWLLFAGRTIRRKNLMEALLLALGCGEKLSFLLTLPADSPDDKPYENMVFSLIRRHRLGAAGFGPQLVNTDFPLNDLALAADMVASCSVMEGFGLIYLEFPLLGRPFFARRNTAIDNLKPIRDRLPHYYFDGLKVPMEKALRDNHLSRYLAKTRALSERLGLPRDLYSGVARFFEDHFSKDWVDFSYLPASGQFHMLENFAPDLAAAVRQNNPALFDDFRTGFHSGGCDPAPVREAVESLFGADVYAENIKRLLSSAASDKTAGFDASVFSGRLLASYFTPENLRLLLDYSPFLTN